VENCAVHNDKERTDGGNRQKETARKTVISGSFINFSGITFLVVLFFILPYLIPSPFSTTLTFLQVLTAFPSLSKQQLEHLLSSFLVRNLIMMQSSST